MGYNLPMEYGQFSSVEKQVRALFIMLGVALVLLVVTLGTIFSYIFKKQPATIESANNRLVKVSSNAESPEFKDSKTKVNSDSKETSDNQQSNSNNNKQDIPSQELDNTVSNQESIDLTSYNVISAKLTQSLYSNNFALTQDKSGVISKKDNKTLFSFNNETIMQYIYYPYYKVFFVLTKDNKADAWNFYQVDTVAQVTPRKLYTYISAAYKVVDFLVFPNSIQEGIPLTQFVLLLVYQKKNAFNFQVRYVNFNKTDYKIYTYSGQFEDILDVLLKNNALTVVIKTGKQNITVDYKLK